ncbi:nuclear transport factor 2 family protein [Mesorhizobium sp. CGMCC 1.15528]|uniref:Nuclear transport factor 2 family protein n=1 Tax=Mesorhizobium zhangyense TaxID=1776730 RepID=A0A7C9VCV7_9HYPH|nr:nuclear transport factor 2 family protein [Mesorhizobium zhangyense]NGN42072.1 nuclear transport factor 2 family protein [Mesorhizobium zhangyense]
MTGKHLTATFLATVLLFPGLPAFADEAVVERWYAALVTVDEDTLSSLLAEDAEMKLLDLGVVQSKPEFLASLDEWREAAHGLVVRYRIEGVTEGATMVLACYDFPANHVLMRETFAISGERIAKNVQMRLAENCEAY